jgi:hypothetical protein
MKIITAFVSLWCLATTISFAQQKDVQLSININPVDAHAAAEFSLSPNGTLYAGIGFGYGSVSTISLNKYFGQSEHHKRNSDVVMPEIFFSPYVNIQYRNYFLRARDIRKGYYAANNSGMYIGARLKMYTAPVIVVKEDARPIKENYMFGLMIGYQKALGAKKRFIYNVNTGLSTHANYNLSFFGLQPVLYTSIGYVIK